MKIMKKPIRIMSSFAVAIALAATAAWLTMNFSLAQQVDPSLPGGASSLRETYQDWGVTCQVAGKTKRCALIQRQVQQDGLLVLAIELQIAAAGTGSGTLVLPFGLKLDGGVTLAVDDRPPRPMHFSTCLSTGCLVPLALDAKTVAGLRTAQAIKINALSSDGQKVTFTVLLKGIAAALDRIGMLEK
ncbi:hypothetical protein R69746_07988 [Paraburkholderia aspalathi]|uniref:invasion associated locus B family protein n=2 Tax=Paraburkholderia aspalathi TaxID=1324617 RepID=UPI001AFEE59A|nr:invasion associated locus B family protein [Paraburkholderia aspalathi]MBK3843950.1 invasion associated locus B family protein [Paraburkholderia aspalathi]CAE6864268.1 hypothetical protein R69746_07988 [Paraburkholderia aspalathi]